MATILNVDDNGPQRYARGRILRQHGFEILDAATGQEALESAARDRPDLILLDVNLPDIHGFDVAQQLKRDDKTRSIPILQISASSVQLEHRTAALDAGADAYLVEPAEPAELVASIRALLRMRDAEAGLRHTTALLAGVVDASPLAIFVFDRDGLVKTWNQAAERMFGVSASSTIGTRLPGDEEAPSGPLVLDSATLDQLKTASSVSGLESRARRQDGSWFDVGVFGAPLEGSGERGFVCILEDISIRKRYERAHAELLLRERDARQEAELASRLKDEFLATLSHELRTPLNAVMGWVQLLQRDALNSETQRRALEVIERNARSQKQLVEDILEVSRIIRGQLRLMLQDLDVVEIMQAAVDSIAPTAITKQQTLRCDFPDDAVIVSGDRERLQQVFWNLLSNAVKYTPRGGRIEVVVTPEDREVSLTVRDSGIGMRPDVLPHIFERFRQADSGPTREFGGLGLGLAIVRHLTDAHGGSVRAHSEGVGHGSAFTVTLPRAVA